MSVPDPVQPVSWPRKRIIVCSDGTWMDSDGDVQVPSNITRIARAINSHGTDSNTGEYLPQVVMYQNGVGTGSTSWWTRLVGGATGEGISLHVREAYAFICMNYHPGDEIILIGFSRGAFTVRSVSSMIRAIGLLTAAGLNYLTPIFEDWKFQEKHGWTTRFPDDPWSDRGKLDTDEYRRKLLELEYTRLEIPVKCVAVFDTVGSLGIPSIWLLPQNDPVDYQLVNSCVEPNIEYAYQALALDERRRPYHPTIWEKPANQPFPRELKQTWFPGVHSDIGGSYPDADLANITLAWMVSQLDHLISFNHEVITRQIRLSREVHEKKGDKLRPWGLGKIHDSMSSFYHLFGSRIRTPMEYCQLERKSTRKLTSARGRQYRNTHRRLRGTHEYVHSSVRVRMGRDGLGYDDQGKYESSALQGWTFEGIETAEDTPIQKSLPGKVGKLRSVLWKKKVESRDEKGRPVIEEIQMPEDHLQRYERLVLSMWPELYDDIDTIRPGGHRLSVRRSSTYPHDSPHLDPAAVRLAADVSPPLRQPALTDEKQEARIRSPHRIGTI